MNSTRRVDVKQRLLPLKAGYLETDLKLPHPLLGVKVKLPGELLLELLVGTLVSI